MDSFPTKIKLVKQGNMGCFVACVAMLLGKNYTQTFKILDPALYQRNSEFWRNRYASINHDDWMKIYPVNYYGLNPYSAFNKLKDLNLKPRKVNIKKIDKIKKTSIIWVRWKSEPELMHSFVYDFSSRKILDPSRNKPINSRGKISIENQLESIIYLDAFKNV